MVLSEMPVNIMKILASYGARCTDFSYVNTKKKSFDFNVCSILLVKTLTVLILTTQKAAKRGRSYKG